MGEEEDSMGVEIIEEQWDDDEVDVCQDDPSLLGATTALGELDPVSGDLEDVLDSVQFEVLPPDVGDDQDLVNGRVWTGFLAEPIKLSRAKLHNFVVRIYSGGQWTATADIEKTSKTRSKWITVKIYLRFVDSVTGRPFPPESRERKWANRPKGWRKVLNKGPMNKKGRRKYGMSGQRDYIVDVFDQLHNGNIGLELQFARKVHHKAPR
jgi:hypothetical protein